MRRRRMHEDNIVPGATELANVIKANNATIRVKS